jgi:hypothetical protein
MKLMRSANPLFISGISQVFIVTILLANSLQASQTHSPENLQVIAPGSSEFTAATEYQLPEALQAQLPKKAKDTSVTQGPIRATTQIVYEGFEAVFPTGLWVIDPPGPSGCFWNRTDVAADVGSWSGSPVVIACGGVPGITYPNNMNSITTYGPFDLSDATSAELRFRLAHELGAGGDLFWYGSSGDGSNYILSSTGGGDFSWQSVSRSLNDHLGDSSVWIMLRMTSDGTSNSARGVLVDEIIVEKSDDPPAPELEMISIDVPDGVYQQGDPLTASTVMGNSGNLISTSSSVDYYASGLYDHLPI